MKSLALLLLVVTATVKAKCDQNCYLGSNLYSAPLDSDNCCQRDLRGNCETFSLISDDDFICRQCQLGFYMIDNQCLPLPDNDIEGRRHCINPSCPSVFYDPCIVCRVGPEGVFVPVLDQRQGRYICQAVQQQSELHVQMTNCRASTIHKSIIFCHECESGFFYDDRVHRCVSDAGMEGCLISFIERKCEICKPTHQYNMGTYGCAGLAVTIDYKANNENLMKRMNEANQQNGLGDNQWLQPAMMQLQQLQGLNNPMQMFQQMQGNNNRSIGDIHFNASMEGNTFKNGHTSQGNANAGGNFVMPVMNGFRPM